MGSLASNPRGTCFEPLEKNHENALDETKDENSVELNISDGNQNEEQHDGEQIQPLPIENTR